MALREEKIRAEIDDRNEKLGYKIREARMEKVPYMIIIGEKEQNHHSISVRQRDAQTDQQEMGEMQLDRFVELIHNQS